jgi:hypothetical protein
MGFIFDNISFFFINLFIMAGTCKYCGFSGTNEALEDHAGECPFYTGETNYHFNKYYSKMKNLKYYIVNVTSKYDIYRDKHDYYASISNSSIKIDEYILGELLPYLQTYESVKLGYIPQNKIWFIT